MAQNISVPDIGDFKDVEVIEILVKPGDQINKNDPIVTIESDKSSVEIPSPSAGQIKDLKVKIGDKVSEGSLLATIENGQAASSPKQEIKQEVVKEELIQEKPKTNGNLNPVKQVKKVFAEPASKDDIDPIETNEWIESLNSVIENDGAPRASYLLNKVIDQAYKSGLVLPLQPRLLMVWGRCSMPAPANAATSKTDEVTHPLDLMIKQLRCFCVFQFHQERMSSCRHLSTKPSSAFRSQLTGINCRILGCQVYQQKVKWSLTTKNFQLP